MYHNASSYPQGPASYAPIHHSYPPQMSFHPPHPMPHTDPYYPAPQFQPPSTMPQMPQRPLKFPPTLKKPLSAIRDILSLNQEVDVYIQTNGWMAGIIVGVLKCAEKVAGWRYNYRIKYETQGRSMEGEFPAESVYPRGFH